MVSAATRALLCIKSEAVGISFFRTSEESQSDDGDDNEALVRTLTELQETRDDLAANLVDLESMPSGQKSLAMAASEQRMKNNLLEMDNSIAETLLTQALVEQSTGTVSIDAQRQYFEMVGAALFSVQSILGERLRNAGSADTSGIFEELKRLASESEEKDEEAEMADDAADNAEEQATNTNKSLVATPAARAQARAAAVAARQEAIELENEALQPKLQSCVLMARTG